MSHHANRAGVEQVTDGSDRVRVGHGPVRTVELVQSPSDSAATEPLEGDFDRPLEVFRAAVDIPAAVVGATK